MEQDELDWVVYLDDTIRRLDRVSPATPVALGINGTLNPIPSGYNEEISVQNESDETLHLVRGGDARVTVIPASQNPMRLESTLSFKNITVNVRKALINPDQPKKSTNEAVSYSLDLETMHKHPIYIPETGAFLCTTGYLTRVKNLCRARYLPIAPDASSQVWIYAHQTEPTHPCLYASVNKSIVRINIAKGETEHVENRLVYYQSNFIPEEKKNYLIDTIPMSHFDKHTTWTTEHGEFVSTSYEELKLLLKNRGIDIEYTQSLRDMLGQKDKELHSLKAQLTAALNPEFQGDILTAKKREIRRSFIKETLDHIKAALGIADTSMSMYHKHDKVKREKAERVSPIFKKIGDASAQCAKALPLILSICKGIKHVVNSQVVRNLALRLVGR